MGAVVSGICLEGVISVNDILLLGPMADGEFLPTTIKGIHRKRMPVKEVRGGQTASFALKKVLHSLCECGYVHSTSMPQCMKEEELLCFHACSVLCIARYPVLHF